MSWHQIIITNPTMAQTAIADLLQQWHAVYREPNASDAVFFLPSGVNARSGHLVGVWGDRVPTTTEPQRSGESRELR